MFRIAKWVVSTIALMFVVAAVSTVARAEEGKGKVSGVVKDADGKPAAGVQIKIMNKMDHAEHKAAKQAEEGKKDKADKPQPVGSAVTDSDGKFSLSDIPAGKYMIGAKMKKGGQAKQEIEVKSGEETKVELTLGPAKNAEAKPVSKPEEK